MLDLDLNIISLLIIYFRILNSKLMLKTKCVFKAATHKDKIWHYSPLYRIGCCPTFQHKTNVWNRCLDRSKVAKKIRIKLNQIWINMLNCWEKVRQFELGSRKTEAIAFQPCSCFLSEYGSFDSLWEENTACKI